MIALWGLWACLCASSAWATQDDVSLPWRAEMWRWSSASDGLAVLDGAWSELTIGPYMQSTDGQRWFGRARGELALISTARWRWRMGFSAETVADEANSISFRLIRIYYEVPMAFDVKLGPGVLVAGFLHRCTHGVDSARTGRILLKTSPQLGYHLQHALAEGLDLSWWAETQVALVGQNTDFTYQPRGLTTLSAQLDWRWLHNLALFASAGVGGAWITALERAVDDEGVYALWDPFTSSRAEALPAAGLGARFDGRAASLVLMLHHHRILDSGLSAQARPASLTSLRITFFH